MNFEYFLDKKTGNWRVSWYDRDTDGTLVRHYDPQPFRKEARARERVHQLRREVGKLGPTVRLCPHRNLYVLHVYVDGRLVRRSLGTRDADEIPARMEKALAKLGLGKAVSSVTVRQFIDRYLIENLDDARLKTRYRTIRTIKVFEQEFGAERNIYSLTQDDVERFVKQRVLTYKPNSVNTEISVWNAAVNYHRKKNLFPAGKTVPTMERVQVPQTEKLLLTETDFDLIFEAARDWRKTRARKNSNRERPSSLEIYLKMVRYSGGRSCFYDDLLWSQVDLENGFINFAVPGVIYKRNKRRPTVPIAAELRPYLERLQQRQAARRRPCALAARPRHFSETSAPCADCVCPI